MSIINEYPSGFCNFPVEQYLNWIWTAGVVHHGLRNMNYSPEDETAKKGEIVVSLTGSGRQVITLGTDFGNVIVINKGFVESEELEVRWPKALGKLATAFFKGDDDVKRLFGYGMAGSGNPTPPIWDMLADVLLATKKEE